jgi:hypothetical protein
MMKNSIPLKKYFWRSPGVWSFILCFVFIQVFSSLQTIGYFNGLKAGIAYLVAVPLILIVTPWLLILILWRGSQVKPILEAQLFCLLGLVIGIFTTYQFIFH